MTSEPEGAAPGRREGGISLAALRCFVAVAESGSLSRAADQLGISQPTVSVTLTGLERASGTLLLHRRLYDARIRVTSTYMDLAVLIILWVQLSLGLITLPFSLAHSDGSVMLILAHWAQGILTLQPVDAKTLQGLAFPYLAHLVLGMSIFLVFPFSRLVHVWSAPVWYLGRRGYQVVRSRRPLGAPGVKPSATPAAE
jgi:respiratory nitrate reductase gamma subunit